MRPSVHRRVVCKTLTECHVLYHVLAIKVWCIVPHSPIFRFRTPKRVGRTDCRFIRHNGSRVGVVYHGCLRAIHQGVHDGRRIHRVDRGGCVRWHHDRCIIPSDRLHWTGRKHFCRWYRCSDRTHRRGVLDTHRTDAFHQRQSGSAHGAKQHFLFRNSGWTK